ncbi:prealbumin-like fold domain-containing protein [Lysobacter firmicutimachus]|uniref:Glycine-rich protein n=1 Tax=Lysobacter firmicutimachus TaxID=1792846 RepID=A0ABU8D6S4_9GAMM
MKFQLIDSARLLGERRVRAAFALLFGGIGAAHAASVPCTPQAGYTHCLRYTYSGGAQAFAVPNGVTRLRATLWGAGGGGSMAASGNSAGGGAGGYADGTVAVASGANLTVTVGQGGIATGTARTYGGGGAGGPGRNHDPASNPQSNGSSGGGMSALWNGAEFVALNALIVAGGGGGSVFWTDQPAAPNRPLAGAGGGGSGGDGTSTYGGKGGSQVAGGAAGLPLASCYVPNASVIPAGAALRGGDGCWPAIVAGTPFEYEGGGGGGGGWFGGGGGTGQNENNPISPTTGYDGPGGGGSGFVGAAVTGGVLTQGAAPSYTAGSTAAPPQTTHPLYSAGIGRGGAAATTQGASAGNGEVILQWSQPILRLQKALPNGRVAATDQFALTIAGSGGPVSVVTTGSGTTATGTATLSAASAGSVYTLSETASGSTALGDYTTTYSCSNALAGGQTPSGSGTRFNVTPVAGDDLTCTFANTRNPRANLTITKTNTPGVNGNVDQSGDTLSRGASTSYVIVVGNSGPDAVTGAILRDPVANRSGLNCTAPPTCSGSACPAAPLTVAALDSGVALGTLANGASVTVTLTCTVN